MIRHILLDLGGVLYGVEYTRTTEALGLPPETLPTLLQDPVLAEYEKGLLTTEAFLAHWQRRFPHLSEAELVDAWCAMLRGPLPEAETFLAKLYPHFSLALFSNTNDLHLAIVEPEIMPWSVYFTDMFFSNRLHLRKPEPEAYQAVLARLGWAPTETLFIDDSPTNITGAQAAGLHTYLLHPANQPLALLSDNKLAATLPLP